jgi:hypothetical protein
MIPKNITRQHILAAITEVDRSGAPDRKASRKFTVDYNGRRYPPKYLVSLANRHANGTELPSSVFNGGAETNDFLRSLGFTVNGLPASGSGMLPTQQPPQVLPQATATSPGSVQGQAVRTSQPLAMSSPSPATPSNVNRVQHTGERCKECKRVVKALLEKNYGPVEENYRFALGTRPKDYANAPCYAVLSEIFTALQQHRGFMEFVGTNTLPPSDFFVPHPGFVVEFDESQHFTKLRSVALGLYPNDLYFGFDLPKWTTLCEQVQARDNDRRVPYRDEQRAWYDTLRDFAPHIKGMLPTLRLYAREFEWCSLDPENATDIETFRQILGERVNYWLID